MLHKKEYGSLDYLLVFVKNNKENKMQYLFLNKKEVKEKYKGSYQTNISFNSLLEIDNFISILKTTFKIFISEEKAKENLQNEIKKYNLENLKIYNNKIIGDIGENFAITILNSKYNITPKKNYHGYYDFKIENKLFDVKVYKYNPNHPNIPHVYRHQITDKKTMNLVFFVYYNEEIYYQFSKHVEHITLNLDNFHHLTSLSQFVQNFDEFYKTADITTNSEYLNG